MSEEKNKIGFSQKLVPHKKLVLAVATLVAVILIGSAVAALITGTSIFGPPSTLSTSTSPTPIPTASPSPTPTTIPMYAGSVGPVTWVVASDPDDHNPATYPVGSTLTLSTTLTPAPLKPQTVWFYYSNTPITVDAHGIPTNPSQLAGIDTVTVPAGSITASVSFVVPASGNSYYYIAEIPIPA